MLNIELYYQSAHVVAMIQWRNHSARLNWLGEQVMAAIPLSEYMLLNKTVRWKYKFKGNYIYEV